ncbi:Dihydroneopterin aldolase [Helicobacter sp. NHP19-012]|uniref:Dihydroneopterin aldolase n=1 Tax=Helicobacter gastrofelis TaxID=2849642 RepID=A0ABM7SFZ1_9HELI|nr:MULTISPECIES: hypothetical protein [Helicobacter]BCZ19772.1 Dihydroneopterin aldolase [Helicobacter sp. NHP19-012]GMB95452.1 Dihydroneopterin aldolase [Helicobacter sp. NHP22-001]CRF51703.1 hypothetical protein HHE06_15970 [Helicobacter heilmannii]
MKIFVSCRSLLLGQVLESYLQEFLATEENCDFILSDHPIKNPYKATCLIGSDSSAYILTPFTKAELLQKLQEFHANKAQSESLEHKVQSLLQEYTYKLLDLLQDYKR